MGLNFRARTSAECSKRIEGEGVDDTLQRGLQFTVLILVKIKHIHGTIGMSCSDVLAIRRLGGPSEEERRAYKVHRESKQVGGLILSEG